MVGIYKFTNTITGKSYIGQSTAIERRYNQHKNRSKEPGIKNEDSLLHREMMKNGFDKFTFEILEECAADKLNEREQFYIGKFNTAYPNGYNLTDGGDSPRPAALESIDYVNKITDVLANSVLSNIEIGRMFGLSDQTISDINCGRSWKRDNIQYPIRGRMHNSANRSNERVCYMCGKDIASDNISGLCRSCCDIAQRKVVRPQKEELYDMLLHDSFEEIGRRYNVTGKAVKKWCTRYGIPSSASYYRSIRRRGVNRQVAGSNPAASFCRQ